MRKMLTVYYDEENGELGPIKEASGFATESLLLRADVLRDLCDAIERAYDTASGAWGASLRAGSA